MRAEFLQDETLSVNAAFFTLQKTGYEFGKRPVEEYLAFLKQQKKNAAELGPQVLALQELQYREQDLLTNIQKALFAIPVTADRPTLVRELSGTKLKLERVTRYIESREFRRCREVLLEVVEVGASTCKELGVGFPHLGELKAQIDNVFPELPAEEEAQDDAK